MGFNGRIVAACDGDNVFVPSGEGAGVIVRCPLIPQEYVFWSF